MKNTNFLSKGAYLSLPSNRNPKVILSAKSKKHLSLAFNLYNPFSLKGKFFKFCLKFLFLNFFFILKNFLKKQLSTNSDFINFLEIEINRSPITSSIYFSTVKEKFVIQIQSNDEIIGYVKFPLNQVGVKNILNEKNAIDVLSSQNIVDRYISFSYYNDTPFIMVKPLEGNIKLHSIIGVKNLIDKFKKPKIFLLKNHPRINKLKKSLESINLLEYNDLLDDICNSSKLSYHEVYEHGDLTPWNIIEHNNNYYPFDFECFEENGLEFLDEIKYHFQIEHLLNLKDGYNLINRLRFVLNLNEFDNIFKIYLLKEIVIKKLNNSCSEMEETLLKYLNNE